MGSIPTGGELVGGIFNRGTSMSKDMVMEKHMAYLESIE